jgi:hypothetical protein
MTPLYTPFIDVTINAEWSDWQNYPQGRPNPIYSQQAGEWGVDGLVFGFLTLSPSNTPCWAASDVMPLEWALPLANELNDQGLKVIISFGGASNSDISTHFSITELAEIYLATVDLYGAHGLDFDLENGLYDAAKICEALKKVSTDKPEVKISFTLPTLPSGLTGVGLGIVDLAKQAGLELALMAWRWITTTLSLTPTWAKRRLTQPPASRTNWRWCILTSAPPSVSPKWASRQ